SVAANLPAYVRVLRCSSIQYPASRATPPLGFTSRLQQIEVRDRSELTKRCEHFLLFGKQLVQDVVDGPVQVLYATSHARWSCPGQYADCIVQFVVFAQSFPIGKCQDSGHGRETSGYSLP